MGQIAEIIKYEGDNSTFIWKHPCEDFNSLTQLIVHESQEAIFIMNGQALNLFGAGRYTLETQNIPLLGKALNRVTGDKTPFHCEVYFINKTEQMSIKWGTDSKVQYVEPTYGFPISIGASGEMSLRAEDSRKLLLKLVGTENYLGQQKLAGYFRAFLMTRVKSYIAQVIKNNAIICAYMALKEDSSKKLFYSISLVRTSYIGLIVSFVVGGLCMLFSPLPYWVGAILCAIVLAINIIAVIKATVAINEVERIDEKIETQTAFVKSLIVDAESLVARAKSETIKSECKKVYEAIRYSDPMSHAELATIESEISHQFSLLVDAVKADDAEKVLDNATEVCLLINDRNKKCKSLK